MLTAVMLFVSPTSTSVSFASNVVMRFAVAAFSSTDTLSPFATGPSLTPVTVIVTLAVDIAPAASASVYVNVSVAAAPAFNESSAAPFAA